MKRSRVNVKAETRSALTFTCDTSNVAYYIFARKSYGVCTYVKITRQWKSILRCNYFRRFGVGLTSIF